MRRFNLIVLLCLSGCIVEPPKPNDPRWAPVNPQSIVVPRPVNGSLYSQGYGLGLYSDHRAHRVGDIITVVLNESTTATKKAETSLSKEEETTFAAPTIFGEASRAGNLTGAITLDGEREFSGEAESDQSNSLNGRITVTVQEVLPNGNMVVRGEKWIGINQGDEFIRVAGIIRPQDVSPRNQISSVQLADARIYYGGRGTLADSNAPGWLAKFFYSPTYAY